MKKNVLRILVVLVAVILFISNPSKEDYIDYRISSLKSLNTTSDLLNAGTAVFGSELLTKLTKRYNVFLFSVFITEDNEKKVYLGVAYSYLRIK